MAVKKFIHPLECPECGGHSNHKSKSMYQKGTPSSGGVYKYKKCEDCGKEFDGHYDDTQTRAESFYVLLKALQEIAGNKFIHGAEAHSIALSALKAVGKS
jgi:hypothetical protein